MIKNASATKKGSTTEKIPPTRIADRQKLKPGGLRITILVAV